MSERTDRISMTLIVATGLFALIGYLLAVRYPTVTRGLPDVVAGVGAVVVAVALVALVWVGLDRFA